MILWCYWPIIYQYFSYGCIEYQLFINAILLLASFKVENRFALIEMRTSLTSPNGFNRLYVRNVLAPTGCLCKWWQRMQADWQKHWQFHSCHWPYSFGTSRWAHTLKTATLFPQTYHTNQLLMLKKYEYYKNSKDHSSLLWLVAQYWFLFHLLELI